MFLICLASSCLNRLILVCCCLLISYYYVRISFCCHFISLSCRHKFLSVVVFLTFLASQDALEVMLESESVSQSVTLRTKLTDVTLVSEDTY